MTSTTPYSEIILVIANEQTMYEQLKIDSLIADTKNQIDMYMKTEASKNMDEL